MTDLPQILIMELGRTTGMLIAWFLDFKLSKKAEIVIYDRAWVNGGNSY